MPHKRTIPRVCQQCGIEFLAPDDNVRKGNGKYCSIPCRHAAQCKKPLPGQRKRCSTCGIVKPIADFFRHKRKSDGHDSRCKVCQRAANAAYYERYPERALAYKVMWNAIRRGDLIRPPTCDRCGQETDVDGHHTDYSRPLDVQWLCRSCHQFVTRRHDAEE